MNTDHPDNLLSGDIQPINPNCTEDGIVRVLVTGGVEPYQLKWQKKEGNDFVDFFPSETDTILEGLTEGTYRVVVTDDDGNGLQTTEEITLNFPDQLIAELQTEDLRCYGQSNGSIQTEVTGGEAPYSYQWQKGEWGVFEDLTGKTQTVLDNVEAGTYRVIITDKRGAQTDERITLHQPDTPLSTTYEIKEPTGFGLTNGSLRVAVEGGTPFDDGTYFFQWHKDSAGGTIITEGITTQVEGDQYRIVLNDIPQGTYYLRVRDKNFENSADDPAGCELLHEFVVTEPDELVATIEVIQDISCHINNQFSRASSLDINKNGIPDNAEDGKIQVNVAGGVSPYTIQWSKKTSGNFDKISRYEELIGALGAGVYRVYIKDANDNITTDEITLIYPEELKLIVEGEDLDCQDEDGGTVTARVSGGAAGYSYYWNTSDGTASLTRQPPGKYYVMVEDAKGCTVDGVGEITYPSPLQIKTLEAQSPSCYGIYDGQIRIEVEGVTESYTVEWSNGARGETLSNLAPGTYTVKVTSEDGCFIIQEYVLTEPDPIVLNIGEGVTLCSGDSQFYNAEIEGIEALYEWVNEKNEVVSTEPQVHLSEAGTYRVQVTTVNGCVLTDEVIIKNSSEVLQPNFVATTYAFTEEVIEIINISYEEPEYMEWIIPEEAEIVSSTTGLLELKFSKSGSYEIGLYARQGDCEKLITKPIIIEDNLFSVEEPSGRVSNILDFKVAPNPNRGQFSTYIDLDEKAEIRIRMLSMQLQELRSPLIEKNQQNYVLSFDQVVASGVYFVILETGKEVRVKKVIIE